MKTQSDRNNSTNSRANANQSFFSENEGNDTGLASAQLAKLQPPQLFTFSSVIQTHPGGEKGNSLSLGEAKKIIIEATEGLGTDEDAIYDAIRRCGNRRSLMYDAGVVKALNGDMEGHELWKSYLLMEYGRESNFPSSIQQLWEATKGLGTDEDAVFAALESMDNRAKSSFGLKYILHSELSGDDLQKALDLITVTDTISGNLFGGQKDGKEDLVIEKDKLRQLIDSRFVGASSTQLKNAMEILYQKPRGNLLKQTLAQVESIRGLPPGSALGQYQKAMNKQAAGIDYYKKYKEDKGEVYDHKVDNPSPPLDIGKHESFTASSAQLRFGKMVGDVFGIDAVFGSLISPTGGMAGPGNDRIPIVKDGGAVATHGAVHDAAGYLYNCHGIGPGYDYLQSEPGSDTSNPLAGQTNMKWWIEEFDKTGNEVQLIERFLNSKAPIGAAFSKIYKKLNTEQKKNALKLICDTSTLMLKLGGLSNADRKEKVIELMNSCSAAEKTVMADYFYNNDGFNTAWSIYKIMRPYVSREVYNAYRRRQQYESMAF